MMNAIRCHKCHNDNYSDGTYCIFCGSKLIPTQINNDNITNKFNSPIQKTTDNKLLKAFRWITLSIPLAFGLFFIGVAIWFFVNTHFYPDYANDYWVLGYLVALLIAAWGITLIKFAIVAWFVPAIGSIFFFGALLLSITDYGWMTEWPIVIAQIPFLISGILNIGIWMIQKHHRPTQSRVSNISINFSNC